MNERQCRLPPDYHTHTSLCKHASGQPADYLQAAREKGVDHLASTDHCPTDDGFGIDHRMQLDQFDTYLAWVDEARQTGEPDLLLGVEADYYPGCERFLGPWLERHRMDLVLGSVHFLDYWSTDPHRRGLGKSPDYDFVWRTYYRLTAELADTRMYDVLTHMDLPKRFGNPIGWDRLRELVLPALDRVAAAGMAIEINTSGRHHPCREFYPSLPILTWAAERGIGLVFGSDAHSPARVGDGFPEAIELARRAGFRHYRVYRKRSYVDMPLPA